MKVPLLELPMEQDDDARRLLDAFVCHCQFLQRANMRCVLRIKISLPQNCSISSFKREKNPTVLGHELLLIISVTELETKRDVDFKLYQGI